MFLVININEILQVKACESIDNVNHVNIVPCLLKVVSTLSTYLTTFVSAIIHVTNEHDVNHYVLVFCFQIAINIVDIGNEGNEVD